MKTCPNCGAEIKAGVFSTVALMSEAEMTLINEYSADKKPGGCTKCCDTALANSRAKCRAELISVREQVWGLMDELPVISLQSPLRWEYEVLGLVTGQSVTGTGIVSEFVSSWTDLFGAQSGRFKTKIRAGEDLCLNQLRIQALDMGANAVIGTDIDYSEVGAAKGMLMVCMAGTAVRLSNLEILGTAKCESLDDLRRLHDRQSTLNDMAEAVKREMD